MALTADKAVPGWHEQIAEIALAVEERESVAAEEMSGESFASFFGSDSPGRLRAVRAQDLRSLTDRILHLADIYLDLGRPVEGSRLGTLAKPAPFGPARLCEPGAAHSLAALPVAMAGRSCAAATKLYRDWLAAARWWLERFRYLDATPFCRFLKLREKTTFPDAVDDSGDTDETTTPEGGLEWGTAVTFDATEWKGRWDGRAYQAITDEDYEEGETFLATDNEISWAQKRGLLAYNETGRDAVLLMAAYAPETPWRETTRLSFNGAPTWDSAERAWRQPGGYDETFERQERFGETLRTVLLEETAAREILFGNQFNGTVHETDTYYTPAGGDSKQETPDPYTRAPRSDARASPPGVRYFRDELAFSDFGLGFAAGAAVTVATVPTRRTIRRDNFLSSDPTPPAEWRGRSHDSTTLSAPGASFRDSTVRVRGVLALAPVFDFGPSFRHLPPTT